MTSLLALLPLLACTGADPCDADADTDTDIDADTGTDTAVLDDDELAGLASWVSAPVTFTIAADGTTVVGARLAIAFAGDVSSLELLTVLTRAQDHNSSRSNKSGIADLGDGFDDDDTASPADGLVQMRWDGSAPCAAAPCLSNGRPQGAASRLAIELGSALDDGETFWTWGETTPMEEAFSGYVALATCCRGHVTVLKAAATGEGGITVGSETTVGYLAVYSGDELAYEGRPNATALATISGVTGASWPKGVTIEETAVGTMVGLSW